MALEDLPPVIQILKDEKFFDLKKPEDVENKLSDSGLMKDLREQAEWSFDHYSFVDSQDSGHHGDFVMTMSSSMSPFHDFGKCSGRACFDSFTDKFAKIVGLYVDRVILADSFTEFFALETSPKPTPILHLTNSIRALSTLLPFIEKGIISFGNPSPGYCESCYKDIADTIAGATAGLVGPTETNFTYDFEQHSGKKCVVFSSPLYSSNEDHPLSNIYPLKKGDIVSLTRAFQNRNTEKKEERIRQIVNELFVRSLQSDLGSVLHDASLAQSTNSVFATGLRLENLFLAEIDNNRPDVSEIERWEDLRAVDLPYVKELSVDDILILREEAQHSLPRLRQLMGQRLRGSDEDSDQAVFDVIAELRDQLNEVEDEINSLSLTKERRYRFGMGGLALSFVIYGLCAGPAIVTAASVAGLLSTIAHLRSHERECDDKLAQVQSKPAFTLFKAKEILRTTK